MLKLLQSTSFYALDNYTVNSAQPTVSCQRRNAKALIGGVAQQENIVH